IVTRIVPAARLALIERILKAAPARGSSRQRTADAQFLRAYFRGVSEDDLAARPPADLAGVGLDHLALGRTLAGAQARVRVFNPDAARDGFASPHTIVQIVTKDMPSLVVSIGIVLARAQVAMHSIVHPVIPMRRDARGRFLGVADSDDPQSSLESWQLYEIDRQSDPAALARLEESIRATIVDVQAAVDDWMPMRDSVRQLAAGLADATPLPADEITEA